MVRLAIECRRGLIVNYGCLGENTTSLLDGNDGIAGTAARVKSFDLFAAPDWPRLISIRGRRHGSPGAWYR